MTSPTSSPSIWIEPPEVEKMDKMAASLFIAGRLDDAIALQEESIRRRRQYFGAPSPFTAMAILELARMVARKSGVSATRSHHEEILATFEGVYGPDHTHVALALRKLIDVERADRNLDAAIVLGRRVLKIEATALGLYHENVDQILAIMASIHREKGDAVGAVMFTEGMKRPRSFGELVAGDETPGLKERVAAAESNAELLDDAGYQLSLSGLHEQADQAATRVLELHQWIFGTWHPVVARSLNSLAAVRAPILGDSGVLPLMEKALQIREMTLGPTSPDLAPSLYNVGAARLNLGDGPGGAALLERYLAAMKGAFTPITAKALEQLVKYYVDVGEAGRARTFGIGLTSMWLGVHGPQNQELAALRKRLALILPSML